MFENSKISLDLEDYEKAKIRILGREEYDKIMKE